MGQNAKKYLAEALILLMKDKSMDEIKINELTKRAGVSRMSYYRYFSDKSEIFEYYMHYIFGLFTQWEKENGVAPFGSKQHIRESLEFFRQYGDFARCIYNSGSDGIMLKTINTYMESQLEFRKSTPVLRYKLYYYAGALYNCYIQWVLEDFKTPVDKLTNILYKK